MLLTITTTHRPADDLGYLLFKHPGRVQSFTESMGTAHVFYPQVGADSCTAALLLEVDPIRLVRRGKVRDADGFALGSYVNDRPYAAGSMLALTLKSVFGTAMTGRCAARPELAATAIPLQIHLLELIEAHGLSPGGSGEGIEDPARPAVEGFGLGHALEGGVAAEGMPWVFDGEG